MRIWEPWTVPYGTRMLYQTRERICSGGKVQWSATLGLFHVVVSLMDLCVIILVSLLRIALELELCNINCIKIRGFFIMQLFAYIFFCALLSSIHKFQFL